MIEESIELIFNKQVASDIFLMGLRSPGISKTAKPGQFVMIRVSNSIDPLLRRPFSICGILDEEIIHILYKVVGRGTTMMADLEAGQRLSVLGPLGNGFELPKIDKTPVLIAGGMGVAPLFLLAQFLKGRGIEYMAGFGSCDEIIPDNLIRGNDIEMSISTDDGTLGHHGMVTDLLNKYIREHYEDKSLLSLFACGPIPMLKVVSAMAENENLHCSVSLEASMACGLGACQGCAIKASKMERRDYFHVCKDGPVFSANKIEWNAL